MLTLPTWVVIGIEQAIIILIVLMLFFFLRARKFKKLMLQYRALSNKNPESKKIAPANLPNADLKEIGITREKLALAEQRIKNLERFRELFFDLKARTTELMEQQAQMYEQMQEAGLPLEEQQALKEAYEKLQAEKATLEQHLQQIEAELNVLMEGTEHPTNENKEDVNAATVIQSHQAEIGKLIQEIADLEVEVAASQRIQSSINQINQHTDELTIAIDVLQDENQFLNDQIQALLQQHREESQQLTFKTDLMSGQLAEKQQAYDELYKKHTKLESEYLKSQS